MGRIWGEVPTKPDKSIAFNPSTAFFILFYRNLSEKKARFYGLFCFYLRIKKDNFKKLLGRIWGEGAFQSKQKNRQQTPAVECN
nr:MAG TPA: hypothetical protein [Caudoviricetes sp.]